MEILIGADPEVFVTRGDEFIPAHGMVPGTKDRPYKTARGAIQVDGCALEFNINPAKSVDAFVRNINSQLAALAKAAQKNDKDNTLRMVSVAQFSQKVFDDLPMEAKVLGCDPDFNAYTLQPNDAPDIMHRPIRTAAGHIHIGWTTDADIHDPTHMEMGAQLVRQLDAIFSVFCKDWPDNNAERQKYYGAWGAFRPKPYGVEYRALSNHWLTSQALMQWVYCVTHWAVEELSQNRVYKMGDATKETLVAAGCPQVEV